jgi:hypothetical protein
MLGRKQQSHIKVDLTNNFLDMILKAQRKTEKTDFIKTKILQLKKMRERARRLAHVVKCLSSKGVALRSSSNTTKKAGHGGEAW